MKSIDNNYITSTALQPFKKGTWSHLQSAYQEVFNAILRGHTDALNNFNTVFVIYGCKVSVSGGNYTVSAGAVYYNGTVYLMDAKGATAVPGGGNTYVCKIKTTYFTDATADPVTFTDSSAQNVHKIEKVEIEAGASGSGIADYADFVGMPIATGGYLSLGSWTGSRPFDFQVDRNIYFSGSSSAGPTFDLQNAKIGCKQKAYVQLNNGENFSVTGTTDYDYQLILPKAGTCTVYSNTSAAIAITSTQQYVIEMEYLGILNSNPRISITVFGL